MAGYDLKRLSPQSFERLVGALAFAEFGSCGTVYSPGPDGARDFTCEGRIKGFEAKDWNGYLVLQCKYRERLEGGQKDISWLKRELAGELSKFVDNRRQLRRPDYYILATNVLLSGSDQISTKGEKKHGGVTLVAGFLQSWKTAIHLKDFHIWHNSTIIDLLADHEKIRRSFSELITSGDVLSKVLEDLQGRRKFQEETITFYLDEDKDLDTNEIGAFLNHVALLSSSGEIIKWKASYAGKVRILNDIKNAQKYDRALDEELREADQIESFLQRFLDCFSSKELTSHLRFGEGQSLDVLYKAVLRELIFFIERGLSKQPERSKISLDIISPINQHLYYVVHVDKSYSDGLFSDYNLNTDIVGRHHIPSSTLAIAALRLNDSARMQLYVAVATKFILDGQPETVEELKSIFYILDEFQVGLH
jgi:hypothetical protein